ncbi:PilZ domain-containing protein [Altererythrobacter sp. ZODW24]|uniref:PilZ domain-containing protein n=1 Tax=Altererythrobacter sp. ZODW24 TaxID=2185142 RepID=UPI000DF72DF8|nr:PilZ domain-containing protein [Altererythrobacter sp. ZODW24]
MTYSDQERRKPRQDVKVLAKYRTGRGTQMDVRVIDISETGCRLFEKRSPLSANDKISMRIEALGPFDAEVVWVEVDTIGIKFVKPLYGPVFDHIKSVLSESLI